MWLKKEEYFCIVFNAHLCDPTYISNQMVKQDRKSVDKHTEQSFIPWFPSLHVSRLHNASSGDREKNTKKYSQNIQPPLRGGESSPS